MRVYSICVCIRVLFVLLRGTSYLIKQNTYLPAQENDLNHQDFHLRVFQGLSNTHIHTHTNVTLIGFRHLNPALLSVRENSKFFFV